MPMGLLYLAGYIESKGYDVNILDLSGGVYKDFKLPEADIYGISMVTPQYHYALKLLNRIKTETGKPVICGGIHPTSLPDSCLGFDAIIRGEGEYALLDIMENGIKEHVYGIQYVDDLNELPDPAWHLIDCESYISNIDVMKYMKSGKSVEREINMFISRGCNGKCAYCTSYKGRARRLSIDRVMSQIIHLKKKYNINRICFCDDNFVLNKRWLRELCDILKDLDIKWHCLGRADMVDYDLCKFMYDHGCMGIDYGIESGSQKILDLVRKNTTVEKQEAGIKSACDAGIKVRAQFIVGLPGETEETFKENYEFIKRNNKYVAKWGIHIFIPFPSCDIWHNPDKYGYKIDKNVDFSDYQTIGNPETWSFQPVEYAERNNRWRKEILQLIKDKDIAK